MAMIDSMKTMINTLLQNDNPITQVGGAGDDDIKNKETIGKNKIIEDLETILKAAVMIMLKQNDNDVTDSVKHKIEEVLKSSHLLTDIKNYINRLLSTGDVITDSDSLRETIKQKIIELLLGNSIIDELQRKVQDMLNAEQALKSVKLKIEDMLKGPNSSDLGNGLNPKTPFPIFGNDVNPKKPFPIFGNDVNPKKPFPIFGNDVNPKKPFPIFGTHSDVIPPPIETPHESLADDATSLISRIDTITETSGTGPPTQFIEHVENINLPNDGTAFVKMDKDVGN
jgi:hypothetical protein